MEPGASRDTGTTTSAGQERTLVVANGQPPSAALFERVRAEAGLLVCVDGGANWACSRGLAPDIVIGDSDSVSQTTVSTLKNSQLVRTPDQEYSDLDKAIRHLVDRKHTVISVLGAMGRRVDHSLANIGLLLKHWPHADITFHTPAEDLFLLNGKWQTGLRRRRRVSLLPMFGRSNVSTQGLLFPLNNEPLEMGVRDGLSNSAVGGPVMVSCGAPLLIAVARSASDAVLFAPAGSGK